MADSVRKRILTALGLQLAGILKANGYNTDAGRHVEHGRAAVSEDDELPRVALVAGENTPVEKPSAGPETRRWILTASGLLAHDDEAPLAIEDLLADIKTAVFQGDLEGLALELESILESTTDPDEGGRTASCLATFAVRYEEMLGKP